MKHSRSRVLQSALLGALLLLAPATPSLGAQPSPQAFLQALSPPSGELRSFYAARGFQPLWIQGGKLRNEAMVALGFLQRADIDGLRPEKYLRSGVEAAVAQAKGGAPDALARAELALSQSFAEYVRDVRRPRNVGAIYGEDTLKPRVPSLLSVLQQAATAPSLDQYLRNVGWMNPVYGQLRREMAKKPWEDGVVFSPKDQMLLRLNLDRASILPVDAPRYILVDTTGARLHFIEHGKVLKTMRVVVGTKDQATPMMVGMVRYATLNPYWHVPTDLTEKRIAPRVLSEGLRYLEESGYEVVSEWSHSAHLIDPKTIDWKAVAEGKTKIFVRQRPGPKNSMGKVKFQFPNELGIYLHDTPAKQLFAEDQRNYSAGCVRLEDADALGALLFGGKLVPTSTKPEETVNLPQPVPVYLTYLTAAPDRNGRIVRRNDIYGRDDAQLAVMARGDAGAGSH